MHTKCYTLVSIFIVLGTLCLLTATANDLQGDISKEKVTRASNVTGLYQNATQCEVNEDCKNGGECEEKINGKFCSCPEGTEGDFCDRVPSCDGVDCGNVAECKYSKDKKAGVCECKNSTLTFIKDGKKCEACRCEDGYCEEEKGELVCKCYSEWGVVPTIYFGDPSCIKCDCGGKYNCTYIIEGSFFKTVKKTCLCPVGYGDKSGKCKGTCKENPCQNGGNCKVKGDGIQCQCKPGFTGDFCEIDKCKEKCKVAEGNKSGEVLCDLDDSGEAVCSCKDPKEVLKEDNTCEACYCKDGYCEEEKGELICKCYEFWVLVPETWSRNPYCFKCDCGGEYNCSYTLEGWLKTVKKTCLCPVGYEDKSGKCKDKCSSLECNNGGTCVIKDDNAVCNCIERYTGKNCKTDKCDALYCRNGGTCVIKDGKAVCNCKDGYTGKNCENDACSSMTCNNGGTCYVKGGKAYCNCTDRYSGKNCEIDKCDALKCNNGGTCTIKDGNAICNCKDRYTGKNCEIDKCSSLTCENDGTCDIKDGEALCICTDGYTGKNCETVDRCLWICGVKRGDRDGEVLCEGGPFGRVTCKCQEENKLFDETQKKCKVMDQCANHVCENGGTCIVYKDIAKCLCRTPFSGDRCEFGRRDENKTLSQLEWVLCSIIVLLILIIGCITIIRSFERRKSNAC